jgi:hypothetical protein
MKLGRGGPAPPNVPPAHAQQVITIRKKLSHESDQAQQDLSKNADWFSSCVVQLCTVRLTSIHNPQIEGKFTENSGGSTNLFYGCKD